MMIVQVAIISTFQNKNSINTEASVGHQSAGHHAALLDCCSCFLSGTIDLSFSGSYVHKQELEENFMRQFVVIMVFPFNRKCI